MTFMRNDAELKISAIINLLTGFLTVLCMVWLIAEVTSVAADDVSATLDVFKYFTIQSNVLSGAVSVVLAVFEIKSIKNKDIKIPAVIHVIRLATTAGVALTMVTVIFYLAPLFGIPLMFGGYNAFFHLLLPLAAIVDFVFFEPTDEIGFKQTFFSLVHYVIYAAVYLGIACSHIVDGKVDAAYDWYSFTAFGVPVGVGMAVLLGLVIFGIAFGLRTANAKIFERRKKKTT